MRKEQILRLLNWTLPRFANLGIKIPKTFHSTFLAEHYWRHRVPIPASRRKPCSARRRTRHAGTRVLPGLAIAAHLGASGLAATKGASPRL